jgi:hypothetical protein
MGLDISHNTWHGAYSAFGRWRSKIAEVAGLPPLNLMEGFYDDSDSPLTLLNYKFPKGDELEMFRLREIFKQMPIRWECLKPNPLHDLLNHSDCDGFIDWDKCGAISDELEKLLPLLSDENGGGHIGSYREKTETFIAGLRSAYAAKERVEFR